MARQYREITRQGTVIGTRAPAASMRHMHPTNAKAAYINAVEAQKRQERGKTACRCTALRLKHFMHVQRMRKLMRGAMPPVPIVEITGDNEWRVRWHHALDALAQPFKLAASATRRKRKMHTHTVQRLFAAIDLDLGMQQAATFETMR
jgi:hypothetical protein